MIDGQRRDVLQHGIQLEITVSQPYTTAAWIVVPVVGVTALVACRRRGTGSRSQSGVSV
jgi:hypothetical protein